MIGKNSENGETMKRKVVIKNKKNKKKSRIFIIIILLAISLGIFAAIKYSKSGFDDGVLCVCIDPGHGGSDSTGATDGETRLEKEDNLLLSLAVKEKLENSGAKVIMTRTDDESISLKERCRIANAKNADYFICLHRNSAADKSAHGSEVWIKNIPTKEETLLAENILANLEKAGISQNRGVKKGYRDSAALNYYINSNTNMPSCLVELGFISNKKDNDDFDKKLDLYAQAIADAVIATYTAGMTNK